MSTPLHPLPTKTKHSIDIVVLLGMLEHAPLDAICTFKQVQIIRNYLDRHPALGIKLSAVAVPGGYRLAIKEVT